MVPAKKTCVIFPGLNGLFKDEDRNRFLAVPEVQTRFAQAEEVFADTFGMKFSFSEFLALPKEELYRIERISMASASITAIQVGVMDAIRNVLPEPEWFLGISMGDTARSVCAGAWSFEAAMVAIVKYTRSIEGADQVGANISLSCAKGEQFSEADLEFFSALNLDASHLTPRFINVAGSRENLKKVAIQAQQKGWRWLESFNYPVHSRELKPYVETVRPEFTQVPFHKPTGRILSSVSCREIYEPTELRDELMETVVAPIHFQKPIDLLIGKHGVERFINIGPCQTNSKFLKELGRSAEVVESAQILF